RLAPPRLDRRRRRRGHVRTEMVGQGRVSLSQLPGRNLQLPWHRRGRCERNAQPEQRSGRRELSLLRLPAGLRLAAETACAPVPRSGREAYLFGEFRSELLTAAAKERQHKQSV